MPEKIKTMLLRLSCPEMLKYSLYSPGKSILMLVGQTRPKMGDKVKKEMMHLRPLARPIRIPFQI